MGRKKKIPKLTCLYCDHWFDIPVNDAREKVFVKTCGEREITHDSEACEEFEPHAYFECPKPNKPRLHIEVCYNMTQNKTCLKWKKCMTGRLITFIIEKYRSDDG